MDNLLISDAPSLVRTPECQGLGFSSFKRSVAVCLTCTDAKLDGFVITIVSVIYALLK